MPRILGVDVPNDKPTYVALTYLYGVGTVSAIDLCYALGVDPQAKASTLSEDDIARINTHLDKELTVEGALRRKVQQDIKTVLCFSTLLLLCCYICISQRIMLFSLCVYVCDGCM